MEPKLMSYITAKYSSKSDMMLSEREWQEVIGKMLPRFKEAGALRQVVTQIWNQEGSFILGNLWEYGVSSIIVPSRGVILHDTRL